MTINEINNLRDRVKNLPQTFLKSNTYGYRLKDRRKKNQRNKKRNFPSLEEKHTFSY